MENQKRVNSMFELVMWIPTERKLVSKTDFERGFQLGIVSRAFFSSVLEAESYIKAWLNEKDSKPWINDIYCFQLMEYQLNTPQMNTGEALSERIYDENGELRIYNEPGINRLMNDHVRYGDS